MDIMQSIYSMSMHSAARIHCYASIWFVVVVVVVAVVVVVVAKLRHSYEQTERRVTQSNMQLQSDQNKD